MLLYPLTPFFVIFCNIVATSDVDDLKLLKEATATVSSIGEHFSFSMNLHRLLSQLIGLCSQLEEPSKQYSATNIADISSSDTAPWLPNTSHAVIPEDAGGNPHSAEPTASSPAAAIEAGTNPPMNNPCLGDPEASKRNSIWDGGLLWELFNIQPSVEWFDAGYDTLIDGHQD